MSITIYIQTDKKGPLTEADLPANASGVDLENLLRKLSVDLDDVTAVLLDETEDPVDLKSKAPLKDLKRGCRVHVTRCQKVRVTVHYLEQTAHETFAGGARVRRVKAWAVKEFKLKERDAVEHVLQLCKSTERPATDTPLHELAERGSCSVCFDLVPERRVEG
jgi:hypothetical protein